MALDTAAVEEVELDAWPEWALAYVPATPSAPRNQALEMHDPLERRDLRRMITEVVSVEGPVADETVLRRVREAWGVGRAGSRIRDAFTECVQALLAQRAIHRVEGLFLAATDEEIKSVRVPFHDEDAVRPVDDVPGAELDVAVERFVIEAMRVSHEELTRRVTWLFGWNRRGSEISRALDESVRRLVHQGRITEDDDLLVARRGY